jgi:hypothetical protein
VASSTRWHKPPLFRRKRIRSIIGTDVRQRHNVLKSSGTSPNLRLRGRPFSGGRDPKITIRMPQALIDQADAWGVVNDMGRSEAIRRLLELGLKAKGK